jgi:hypothetical protein
MAARITCIKKDNGYHENPHVAIESLDWINEQTNETGRTNRLDMYDFLVNKNGQAYVRDSRGNIAYLQGAVSGSGNPYVRTVTDGKWTDNLLALPECR